MIRRRRWLLVGAALLVGVFVLPAEASPPTKVEICHYNVDGDLNAPEWELLEVSEVGKAFEKHMAHGDGIPGGEVPGTNGDYAFDEFCVPYATELIFAVAYTDINTTDGDYNPDVDVLIAKLIDGPNGDGVPGAGDLVITYQYPLNTAATSFGSFGITQHTLNSVYGPHPWFSGMIGNWPSYPQLKFEHATGWYERYTETGESTWFADYHELSSTDDSVIVNPFSPSQPPGWSIDFGTYSLQDDAFVDVDIYYP